MGPPPGRPFAAEYAAQKNEDNWTEECESFAAEYAAQKAMVAVASSRSLVRCRIRSSETIGDAVGMHQSRSLPNTQLRNHIAIEDRGDRCSLPNTQLRKI